MLCPYCKKEFRQKRPNQIYCCRRHKECASDIRTGSKKRMAQKCRLKRFGITVEEYKERLLNQNNVCAICGRRNKNGVRLSIDHDHKTSKIRGLLCGKCNVGIGLFNHDRDILHKAILYLS